MAVVASFSRRARIASYRDYVLAVAMITLGALLRLALFRVPEHGVDSWIYRHWTWRLVHEPLTTFYVDDGQAFPDHLPGDIWLFKMLGEFVHAVNRDIDFYRTGYIAVIAAMVTLFDGLLAVALWRTGKRIGKERQGAIAGLAWWCMPAPMFVASVWGQVDGIAAAIAIVALGLAVSGRYSRAFFVLTLCVLVKPHYALLTLPLLAAWWHTRGDRTTRWLRDVALTSAGCVALVAAVIAPFDMSIAGEWGRWSLLERMWLSAGLYPASALGAHNLWGILDPFGMTPDDRLPWIMGLSRQAIGWLLFAVIVGTVCWALFARWRGVVTMVLASNVLIMGYFLVSTRMHERYLFPVLGMSLLLAVLDERYWHYAFAANLLVFANIALRYLWPLNDTWTRWRFLTGFGWLEHAWTVWALTIATFALFALLVYRLVASESLQT